jgi:hypothetical protein
MKPIQELVMRKINPNHINIENHLTLCRMRKKKKDSITTGKKVDDSNIGQIARIIGFLVILIRAQNISPESSP